MPYRVEFYCPRMDPTRWQSVSDNPFFIYGNAVKRCNALLWAYHASRVLDSAGNVVYQVGG